MQLYNYERFLPHGGESSETSKANSGCSSDAKHFQSQQVSQWFPLCSAKPTESYIPQGVYRLRSANQNRTRTFYKPNPNFQKVLLMLSVKCGHTSQFCQERSVMRTEAPPSAPPPDRLANPIKAFPAVRCHFWSNHTPTQSCHCPNLSNC